MAYSEIYEEKMRNKDYSKVSISEVAGRLQDKYGYSDNIIEVSNGVNIDFQLKEKIGVTEKGSKTISVIETNGDNIGYYVNIKGSYYKIKIGEKNVELEETESLPGDVNKMRLEIESPSDGDIAKVKAQNSLLEVTGVKKGDTTVKVKLTVGSKEKEQTIKIGVYKGSGNLADVAEIGDYVDIGIEYENNKNVIFQTSYTKGTYDSHGMVGWRVLSKDNGTVKLISAGIPLTFYLTKGEQILNSLEDFEDLYKTITINKDANKGFTYSGFTDGNDLKSIFSNCKYIDLSKGVHTVKAEEIVELYNKLNEKSSISSLTEIWRYNNSEENFHAFRTDDMDLRETEYDLLGIGFSYYISKIYMHEEVRHCYMVYDTGGIDFVYNAMGGIRPVVTLDSDVRVDSNNTGSGLSSKSALKLR